MTETTSARLSRRGFLGASAAGALTVPLALGGTRTAAAATGDEIVEVHPDHLAVDGFGREPDRRLPLRSQCAPGEVVRVTA